MSKNIPSIEWQFRNVLLPYRALFDPLRINTGREKNGATSSSRTPAVTSPAAATSATGSKAKDSATSASTSGVSPKIPTLKISLKFNQATGKAYTNSPQSSLSVSSPKSMSISPSVKSPTITTANTPSPRKKRPLDKDAPSTSSSAASCSPSPAKRRNSAAGGVKPGDYEMTCNSYSEARLRKKHPDSDLMLCECRPPPADQPNAVGCGDSCGSRNSYMECDPATCPCGTRCSNQTIQRGQGVADLELFQTPQKGQGVRCKSNIKKGTFICEYIGEVLSTDKFIDRMKEKGYKEAAHHYFLKLDHNKVIDAYRCGSIARFINHSCEPNSQTQKWLVNGQDRMAFFAREDIPAGQEITYDYKFESFDEQPQKCFCGTKSCRGTIGVKKSQKLNGLLMKKKQTAASSSTAELSAHASPSSSAVSSPKPASLVIPAPVIKERVAVSAETAASDPAEMWREAQFSLKHMIFLGRNRRHGVALGRRSGGKRPKIVPQILITSLPALCSTTVKALFPASQGFPAEYFKPVAWEPSVADVAKYSAPPFQEEVIRCICGIYMEDSTMVECDRCKNWQHCECVGHIPIGRNASYLCDRCAPRPLPREIHQNLPAASNPDNLDCYNTLLVPNCQNFYVRVGDCVYLTKDRQPPLPGLLYDPLTVDILFVDKMWMNSAGVKWIFGWHYLRPHETFHEASRSFFEQELLKTSHHLETVKLDAVLGRCCVMDSQTFAKGKPKEYPLQHCFICDLKVNKATNQFVTMKAKERVTVNTHQYYFELYPERLTVRRTFKPHQVPVLKKKLKMDAALSARKPSDAPESDTNMIKDRCLHIHSVLENLARRRQPLSSKADS
ncbi:Histone-lysine N-methyltransferase ASH1L [Hypsibius exemplaris]|uniref:Histone-lysine N-methyltransferase ASH1L n=1 Tax=Hypsibius exemplaris TaxID=2072580 RepID=A0A1W0WAS1_HYPEX|nr:Histone-lysine N-methyltransferase ASH1L [Hypsibius exemplaris]